MSFETPKSPGWYRNPREPFERWFDGAQWTDHTREGAYEPATMMSARKLPRESTAHGSPRPKSQQQKTHLDQSEPRGWLWMSVGAIGFLVVVLVIVGVSYDFPTNRTPQDETSAAASITVACEASAEKANADQQLLYGTHPLHSTDVPGPEASDEEWVAYEALQDDEEAQWSALMAPIYSACESPADLYLAFKLYPLLAGVTDEEFVAPDQLVHYCTFSADQQACIGVAEWAATVE